MSGGGESVSREGSSNGGRWKARGRCGEACGTRVRGGRYRSPRKVEMLEIVAHILEDRGNLRAKQDKSTNDDNCYQGNDQGIFDEALAFVAT